MNNPFRPRYYDRQYHRVLIKNPAKGWYEWAYVPRWYQPDPPPPGYQIKPGSD